MLDQYIQNAWEPTLSDFEQFRVEFERLRTEYSHIYKTIPDQLFAHRSIVADASVLMLNATVVKIDELLYFLNEIITSIFELFSNGRRHQIGKGTRDYIDKIISDTHRVLERLN